MKKIAIVILMLCLASLYFWQKDRPTHAIQDMPSWPSIDQALVTDIQVSNHTGESIVLHKQEVWMLGDKLADTVAVQRVLDNLHDMQPIRVVTRNPEQYARLEVLGNSARIVLSDSAGNVLLDLHVGKQGSDLISTYVRLHDAKEVIAVNKALVWQVNRTQESWQKADEDPIVQDTYSDPYSLINTTE